MNIKNFIKNIIEYWEHPYEKSIKLNIKDLSYENLKKKNEKELIKLKSLLIFKIKEKECIKSIFKFISKIGSLCVACLTILNTSLNMLIQNFVAPLYKDISNKDKGKKSMDIFLKNIKNFLLKILENDKNVRSNSFNEDLTPEIFVDYIFNLLIYLIFNKNTNCNALIKLIENTIY